ncbi:MAG: HIT domain-containing protein [Candidatus Eremiobacteraeota bacterium]|nr:HIT domain-containing protein [Candidatus Eremiobacteraeota bacterium]
MTNSSAPRYEPDCIFCKVGSGELRSRPAYRDARIVAIEDINPQAPAHLLVMPVEHYTTLGELIDAGDSALVTGLFETAARLGRERGGERGFRLVVNTGSEGGQTVGHVHVHVLAGRHMTWPPG